MNYFLVKSNTNCNIFFRICFLIIAVFIVSAFQQLSAHDAHGASQDDTYWAEKASTYPPFLLPGIDLKKIKKNGAKETYSMMGNWGEIIEWPLVAVSAANLPDGRILTFSSFGRKSFFAGWKGDEYTHVAIWNPDTGEIMENDNTSRDLFAAHLTMLEDGRLAAETATKGHSIISPQLPIIE